MRTPSAQEPPRVPRSRRDDRYNRSHPMPYKQPGVGVVVSHEDDTITVRVLDQDLPYVIPLGTLPPVDSVVELETRGELLVVPADEDIPPLVVVHHGTDGTVARPNATWVLWLGTAEPANGLLYDCWEEANI